ncbi:MAG TPA: carbohydrate-binding protein [Tissierellaceae bacterium]|nr:carbohydrate-binding protein [Tissierellaceae bacterium]
MNRIERARAFKNRINANLQATRGLVRVDEISEEELVEIIDLYPQYKIGRVYVVDEIFKYEGRLYKVIQLHISQEDWLPNELPAMYFNLMPENVIPEWVQPTGSHDAYKIGDKAIYEGEVYESLIDGNTWSPGDYPEGWKVEVV